MTRRGLAECRGAPVETPYDVRVSLRADRRLERAIVMTIVVLVILAAIFVFWEQAAFDSDQAIVGLMAKHLSEGRAFPLFMYGSNYVFTIEAWMATSVFLAAGASVSALKMASRDQHCGRPAARVAARA
jgi:hypothetical protein